jgi:hypothetical protein
VSSRVPPALGFGEFDGRVVYTALAAGKRPDATPDRSFRQFAAREQLSAQAPLPPAWIAAPPRELPTYRGRNPRSRVDRASSRDQWRQQQPPKRPSVAVIHTHQSFPQLHLPGTSVRSLTIGPGLDLAAGRIVYLLNGDDLSLIVRFEKGRFAKELIVALAQSTADHLIGLLDLP